MSEVKPWSYINYTFTQILDWKRQLKNAQIFSLNYVNTEIHKLRNYDFQVQHNMVYFKGKRVKVGYYL